MKANQTDGTCRIGWSDIMRIHVDSIGKADRETGLWVDTGDEALSRASDGKAVESTEGVGKDRK